MGIFSIGKKKQQEPETKAAKGSIAERLDQKMRDTGKDMAVGGINNKIRQLVKEGRLAFLDGDNLAYTNKQGDKRTLTFGGMAMILVDASGFDNLVQLGITPNDVEALLAEEWNKLTGGGKR